LIQSGLYPKKTLFKHFTAVISAGWISISDPVEFFHNPVQSGSDSEVQNPVGSRSGNWLGTELSIGLDLDGTGPGLSKFCWNWIGYWL